MRRSIRDYLITLFLGVVVFAVAAFFLLRAAEGLMLDVVDKIGSEGEEELPVTAEPLTDEASVPVGGEAQEEIEKKDETLSILVMVEDETGQKLNALYLMGINAAEDKKKATVALIPANTVVPEGSDKYKLGDLYKKKSKSFYLSFVEQETGIAADFYMAISVSGISNLVDFFGGLSYSVPAAMESFDEETNFKVSLKAGKQVLTGDQTAQLFCYKGYGRSDIENTHVGLARAFCNAFLKADNLARAKAVFYNVRYHMETNFEERDFEQLGAGLFNFGSYQTDYVRIPGAETGTEYYAISTSRAESMFKDYR